MAKIILINGHGASDPGAVANGTNERDFIRQNITPKVAKYLKDAGHSVSIYNTAHDCYSDTRKGSGLYSIYNNKFDIVVEFHLDAASPQANGGHVIIPSGLSADNIDKGLQTALNNHVGTIRGIDGRSDLLHCNVAKQLGLNYRLVELGFITNKGDMDYIKNNLNAFTKDLADAINGKEIAVKQKAPVKKAIIKPSTSTYTVKDGDTLWGIATKYKLSVAKLKELNKLKSNVIYKGQKLKVKK